MNDRTPTTVERHPWLLIPVVLLAALLTAFLRPVPAAGSPPAVHRAPAPAAAPIVVLPGERPAVGCADRSSSGRVGLLARSDDVARRAIVIVGQATSGDVGRSATVLVRVVGQAVIAGQRPAGAVPCSIATGPVVLRATGW